MVLKLVFVNCIIKKIFKCLFFYRIGIVEVILDLYRIKYDVVDFFVVLFLE